MGIVGKPTIQSYWAVGTIHDNSWFRQIFSRNRFGMLLQFFHVAHNSNLSKPGEEGYNPCRKFAPVLEHANRIFRTFPIGRVLLKEVSYREPRHPPWGTLH